MADPRPSGGKTATIKQRRVEIYLPSIQTKEAWTAAAEKRGQSLSEMIFHIVHSQLEEGDSASTRRAGALAAELERLQEQLDAARAQVEHYRNLSERLDQDLKVYRTQAYTGAGTDQAPLDARLISLFKTAKDREGKPVPLTDEDLRRGLRIAATDREGTKALVGQLVELEGGMAIKKTPQGWVWLAQ